ncbi:uncharacterized protein Z520_09166 [Fonsecaea multimorphosa CBS 102226]|uniref:Fungal N-terminal domain-containing protein n=1 Tax=Fonsecaea multimorphosa CBS 102226 TaxID=1442371 RepID=A0A0D2JXI9_9EURO|nr:uncharacterized protein Z520_09166 [Fonsecaea multimorphosa CBS 102226]KIX95249.1 hypothetical protein Z520_09166 [Fonsecaea multimorphosa CBS 102226]
MDPLSVAVSVSSLLASGAKVVKAASALRSQYRDAAFMLSAISSECTVINTSLGMLQSLMMSNPESLESRMTYLVISTFEVALTGCALTMSVVEDELGGLLIEDENGNLKARRIKYVMEQNHLKEMLQQIRGQQTGISLLLQTYQANTNAEVNEMVQQNNALLRQIANRGRSFYLESVHDGERRATVAGSLEATDLSILDTSSSVDDREFDFDDEIINAGAYRRALASLRHKDHFGEEMSNNLPPEDGDKTLVSTALTNESNGSTQNDTNNPHQKTPLPGREETILATSGTYETEIVINQLQDMEGDSMKTSAQYELKLPHAAKMPDTLFDPRTSQTLKETSGPLEITTPQMLDTKKTAVTPQGELPTDRSRVTPPSRVEIQTEKEYPEGRFGISDVGRSQTAPGQLKSDRTYAAMKYVRGHTDGIRYGPTIYDRYGADIEIDGNLCLLDFQDTAGLEDYDSVREYSYSDCDVALLFFSIDNPNSLDNIRGRWAREIHPFLTHVPRILVGCKADLRDDPKTIEKLAKTSQKPVSRQQAEEVARNISRIYQFSSFHQRTVKYMECSSFTGDGINGVFEEAARLGLQYSIKKDKMKSRGISGVFRRRP